MLPAAVSCFRYVFTLITAPLADTCYIAADTRALLAMMMLRHYAIDYAAFMIRCCATADGQPLLRLHYFH